MKPAIIALALFASGMTVLAKDHLIPERGVFTQDEGYHIKVRELLAEAFDGDIVLQAVFLPSFQPEGIAGIRKTENGFEAFASRPSYHIAGKIGAAQLKQETPPDFHDLTVQTKTRAISAALTERIRRAWQDMVLNARFPKSPRRGTDGMDVHFSIWVSGHGYVGAQIWSPERGKAAALEDLAEVLGDYAEAKADEKKLGKAVRPLER
ncbi:MAG: hypothetical protein QOJ87_1348 [Verrucomicrobiota bacterium]|jgi:hypothetical protein